MSNALPLADIGVKALYSLFVWLATCIAASWISDRKGFGERPGLATGLLLTPAGLLLTLTIIPFVPLAAIPPIVIWLVWPAKANSAWKREGALPKRHAPPAVAPPAAAEGDGAHSPPPDA